MNIFLGITGASGAPYASRLISALVDAGCEVGVCISDSGYEVLATELYGNPSLPHDEVLDLFTRGLDGVTVYAKDEYSAPYASGSARVDGYAICPCAMANLVHRAASVALKEGRRLVLVPRETPLSTIHLENLLRLRQAGATIVFAAPGFYHRPGSIDDLVDFIVARCLDQLGVEHALVGRWGQD